MKKFSMLFFAIFAAACSQNEREFRAQYVQKFVAACAGSTGGSDFMKDICTCQANKIVANMKPSETSDIDKVKKFVLETAAPECAREALAKKR
jgi:hypothetical protein